MVEGGFAEPQAFWEGAVAARQIAKKLRRSPGARLGAVSQTAFAMGVRFR
jgi:hypothetical protein